MIRRLALRRYRVDRRLSALKVRAIDIACRRFDCSVVVDLGGVWAVDGGYGRYALDRHDAARVTIVDEDFTAPLVRRAARDPRLRLIEGNFGRPEIAAEVGAVDATLLFDVLLHQVSPDWNEALSLYANYTRCFVLAGPWWTGPETVRLLDLGREQYLANVPVRDFHAKIWDRLDEINEHRGRPWRDCHDIWQWGITDESLRNCMAKLGFRLVFHENLGSWRGLPRFADSSYVFVRETR